MSSFLISPLKIRFEGWAEEAIGYGPEQFVVREDGLCYKDVDVFTLYMAFRAGVASEQIRKARAIAEVVAALP